MFSRIIKYKNFSFLFLLIVIFSPSFSLATGFEKSISIDTKFSVAKLKSEANKGLLESKSLIITNLTSNIFRSYQQDFDYRFFNNYQLKGEKESTFICYGTLVDRAYMNANSELYAFKEGEYFLQLEIFDPIANETIFGKSFMIDAFIRRNETPTLTRQLQEALKIPLSLYFFTTSRTLTAYNNRLDSTSIAINSIIGGNAEANFTRNLTDLANNVLVMHQFGTKTQHVAGEKYRFQYFKNYTQPQSANQASTCELRGSLNFDSAKQSYTLSISLFTQNREVSLPKLLNEPIVFHATDKTSYEQVALPLKQKIGLLLYYYFEHYHH